MTPSQETVPVQVVRISKAERDYVANAAFDVFPRLRVLGRDALVGDADACVLLTAQVEAVLEGEARAEMARARDARVSVEKGHVFRHVSRFRRTLEAIRADAEAASAKRNAERAAKSDAAPAAEKVG